MKTYEYLDAVKQRLSVDSDYELARRLGVKNGPLCQMRKGERAVPLDVAFKIAITLELDPALVVADLEAQREKNAERRAFWAGFTQRARAAVVLLACTLVWSFSGICANEAAAHGGFFRRRLFA